MLRLFRWNGEQVKQADLPLTVENALALYRQYMGDVNGNLLPEMKQDGGTVLFVFNGMFAKWF